MKERLERLHTEISLEGIWVVSKTGWFWNLLACLVKYFAPNFLTNYWTTIGPWIARPAVPLPVDEDDHWRELAVLTHERVHCRQFAWCGVMTLMACAALIAMLIDGRAAGLGVIGLMLPLVSFRACAVIGIPLMLLVWLLLPLPMGLAYGRWCLERSAYLAGYRVRIEQGIPPGTLVAAVTRQLGARPYGWTWPARWVHHWFARHLAH